VYLGINGLIFAVDNQTGRPSFGRQFWSPSVVLSPQGLAAEVKQTLPLGQT